ncbi:hypothetical protein FXO38_27896 [Capsicum annuum]|nr:hypothetical protein FXO38_27896 [Capsicum annuum]
MPPRTDVVLDESLSTYVAHFALRKTSSCDVVVFRERPLEIVCLTVWNGTHATLERQEANSGEMGRDEPERQRAESQWIVAARPLCHLQYPVTSLSRLQRILPAARWKLYFKGAIRTLLPRSLSQRHVPLGAEAPTAGHQADGGCMRRF